MTADDVTLPQRAGQSSAPQGNTRPGGPPSTTSTGARSSNIAVVPVAPLKSMAASSTARSPQAKISSSTPPSSHTSKPTTAQVATDGGDVIDVVNANSVSSCKAVVLVPPYDCGNHSTLLTLCEKVCPPPQLNQNNTEENESPPRAFNYRTSLLQGELLTFALILQPWPSTIPFDQPQPSHTATGTGTPTMTTVPPSMDGNREVEANNSSKAERKSGTDTSRRHTDEKKESKLSDWYSLWRREAELVSISADIVIQDGVPKTSDTSTPSRKGSTSLNNQPQGSQSGPQPPSALSTQLWEAQAFPVETPDGMVTLRLTNPTPREDLIVFLIKIPLSVAPSSLDRSLELRVALTWTNDLLDGGAVTASHERQQSLSSVSTATHSTTTSSSTKAVATSTQSPPPHSSPRPRRDQPHSGRPSDAAVASAHPAVPGRTSSIISTAADSSGAVVETHNLQQRLHAPQPSAIQQIPPYSSALTAGIYTGKKMGVMYHPEIYNVSQVDVTQWASTSKQTRVTKQNGSTGTPMGSRAQTCDLDSLPDPSSGSPSSPPPTTPLRSSSPQGAPQPMPFPRQSLGVIDPIATNIELLTQAIAAPAYWQFCHTKGSESSLSRSSGTATDSGPQRHTATTTKTIVVSCPVVVRRSLHLTNSLIDNSLYVQLTNITEDSILVVEDIHTRSLSSSPNAQYPVVLTPNDQYSFLLHLDPRAVAPKGPPSWPKKSSPHPSQVADAHPLQGPSGSSLSTTPQGPHDVVHAHTRGQGGGGAAEMQRIGLPLCVKWSLYNGLGPGTWSYFAGTVQVQAQTPLELTVMCLSFCVPGEVMTAVLTVENHDPVQDLHLTLQMPHGLDEYTDEDPSGFQYKTPHARPFIPLTLSQDIGLIASGDKKTTHVQFLATQQGVHLIPTMILYDIITRQTFLAKGGLVTVVAEIPELS